MIAAIESLAAPAIATLVASELLPFIKRTKHNGVLSILFSILKAVARELAATEVPNTAELKAQLRAEIEAEQNVAKGPKRGANGKFVKG